MSKGDTIGNTAVAVLALCAVTLTGLTVWREFHPPSVPASGAAPVHVPSWRQYTRGGHQLGPANAAMTIVEFVDFQCPFCAHLADSLHVILGRRSDVNVVFHHFPLDGHPFAELAAEASECANSQGAFAAYHDYLFANRDSIGHKSWAVIAAEVGIPDTTRFSACVRSGDMRKVIQQDIALGKKAGVVGTPTVIINGEEYVGIPPELSALSVRGTTSPAN
jgi:protein-disulfide isomerase